MEKVANIAASFEEAERWDRDQCGRMTLLERVDSVEFLREQCLVVAGITEIPRIQKKGAILSPHHEAAS